MRHRLLKFALLTALWSAGAAPMAARAQDDVAPAASDRKLTYSWSAELRGRYEGLTDQYVATLPGGDSLLNTRLRLFGEMHYGHFGVGGEIEDSRAFGADPDTPLSTATVNSLEPIQLYGSYKQDGVTRWDLDIAAKAGRFTFDLGSRRMIGRNNFRNTTNSFFGLHSTFKTAGDIETTAFIVRPMQGLPDDREGLENNTTHIDEVNDNSTVTGVHVALPVSARVKSEVYLINLQEQPLSRDRELMTLGARLQGRTFRDQVDFDLEAAVQDGSQLFDTQETNAFSGTFVHLSASHTLQNPENVRVGIFYDWASGDDPATDRVTNFDPLFGPRRGDFGPTGLYGAFQRTNISAPGVRVSFDPPGNLDGFVNVRGVWLDQAAAALPRFGVVDPTGESGDFVGIQIDGRARYFRDAPPLNLEAGFAFLESGEYLENVPNSGLTGRTLYTHFDVVRKF